MKPHLSKQIRAQYLKMTRPKVGFRIPDLQTYYNVRTDLSHYRFDAGVMEDLIRLNLKYFYEDRRLNRYRLFQQTVGFRASQRRHELECAQEKSLYRI